MSTHRRYDQPSVPVTSQNDPHQRWVPPAPPDTHDYRRRYKLSTNRPTKLDPPSHQSRPSAESRLYSSSHGYRSDGPGSLYNAVSYQGVPGPSASAVGRASQSSNVPHLAQTSSSSSSTHAPFRPNASNSTRTHRTRRETSRDPRIHVHKFASAESSPLSSHDGISSTENNSKTGHSLPAQGGYHSEAGASQLTHPLSVTQIVFISSRNMDSPKRWHEALSK